MYKGHMDHRGLESRVGSGDGRGRDEWWWGKSRQLYLNNKKVWEIKYSHLLFNKNNEQTIPWEILLRNSKRSYNQIRKYKESIITDIKAILFIYSVCFSSFIFLTVVQLQLSAFSPHPSTPTQPNPPPSPTSTLPLDFVQVSFIVVPVIPSPHCPLPTPFWLLLDCS